MSTSRNSGPEYPISLRPKTTAATNVLIVSSLAVIACCLFSLPTYAQGSLPLGTIGVTPPQLCAPGSGFYYYSSGGTNYYMNCQTGTVTCSNISSTIANLSLTFAYMNPATIQPPLVSQAKGLIVLHGGGGGTSPESFELADAYFKAGYEVVQLAWTDDWEMTSDPFTGPANIQQAACRPATFFNYVFTTLFPNVLSANSQAGMCALGDSAGSAAVAYSLAYYGAGSYLDNVELLSGPVLSDIEQGCQVNSPGGFDSPVTVCGQTNYQGGQYGCALGTGGSTWTLGPEYVSGAQTAVGKWTNNNSCAGSGTTSSGSNTAWLNQSIVDQSSGGAGQGAVPTFNYPYTAMSAWLCRSVVNDVNGVSYNCGATNNGNSNYCPNNSSSQGQIFYENIGVNNSPPHYAVYAVDNCVTAEGVGAGNVPGYAPAVFNGTISGFNAIVDDMIGHAPAITAECVHRNHSQ